MRVLSLGVAVLMLAACADSTGPHVTEIPGTLRLPSSEFASWLWTPDGQEILYSTPFDYPDTGSSTSLEAIAVATGARRTVVARLPSPARIIGYRFSIRGAHVYFEVTKEPDRVSLYRVPLDGSSGAEVVLDTGSYGMTMSPDVRFVAWIEASYKLVLVDVSTRNRREYALEGGASRVTWSPNGGSLVADSPESWQNTGTPFHWLDLSTGTMKLWRAPADEVTAGSSRDIVWEGNNPMVYVVHASVLRYSIATGAREPLATLPMRANAAGWSSDHGTVFTMSVDCLEVSTGPFGGDCIRWHSTLDKLVLATGARVNVVQHEGKDTIAGVIDPTATWFVFGYLDCGQGCHSQRSGLYVLRL